MSPSVDTRGCPGCTVRRWRGPPPSGGRRPRWTGTRARPGRHGGGRTCADWSPRTSAGRAARRGRRWSHVRHDEGGEPHPRGSLVLVHDQAPRQERLDRLRPEQPVDERLRQPARPQRRQAHPLLCTVCHHGRRVPRGRSRENRQVGHGGGSGLPPRPEASGPLPLGRSSGSRASSGRSHRQNSSSSMRRQCAITVRVPHMGTPTARGGRQRH